MMDHITQKNSAEMGIGHMKDYFGPKILVKCSIVKPIGVNVEILIPEKNQLRFVYTLFMSFDQSPDKTSFDFL